jgi:hypothetical protein
MDTYSAHTHPLNTHIYIYICTRYNISYEQETGSVNSEIEDVITTYVLLSQRFRILRKRIVWHSWRCKCAISFLSLNCLPLGCFNYQGMMVNQNV